MLDACYERGINAKDRRDHANTVGTPGIESRRLADLKLVTWHEYALRRAFDIALAAVGVDIAYIREQSFWVDLKILVRQV